MKDIEIKDVMIQLPDYATVSEDDSLSDAIAVLKKSQQNSTHKYKHRAVLVFNRQGHITGKLSMFDIIKALEPKYRHFEHPESFSGIGLSRFGLNHDFLKSLIGTFSLWDETLEELVRKALIIPVRDIMYSPAECEYVNIDRPISEAVHQFILGSHQSLLVLKGKRVIGVLRLSDIFNLICNVARKR